jgi:hypothetical protein
MKNVPGIRELNMIPVTLTIIATVENVKAMIFALIDHQKLSRQYLNFTPKPLGVL